VIGLVSKENPKKSDIERQKSEIAFGAGVSKSLLSICTPPASNLFVPFQPVLILKLVRHKKYFRLSGAALQQQNFMKRPLGLSG